MKNAKEMVRMLMANGGFADGEFFECKIHLKYRKSAMRKDY